VSEDVRRLDRISTEAQKLQFGRAFLTIAFMPFFLLGWVAGKCWSAIAYILASIKVGWQEGSS
jgi:hypothetical protein